MGDNWSSNAQVEVVGVVEVKRTCGSMYASSQQSREKQRVIVLSYSGGRARRGRCERQDVMDARKVKDRCELID